MSEMIQSQAILDAFQRACDSLLANADYLTSLDQAMGDGDLGITMTKVANALKEFLAKESVEDFGKFFMAAGMAANNAAPSTMGTLLATALMRAGKAIKGKTEIDSNDVVEMLKAANLGIQERGKAKPGDKTIIDAITPAQVALESAVAAGDSLKVAGQKALKAAEEGRDLMTPQRNRVGRASWLGERTEGLVDPGCAAFVAIMQGLVG